jgi:hypothetical protein
MEHPRLSFVVSCVGCGLPLMTVDRIRDGEVRALKAHLRVCLRLEPADGDLPLGAVMEHVQVAVAGERSGSSGDGTR